MKNKVKYSFLSFSLAAFAASIIMITGCSMPDGKTKEATENLVEAKRELDKAQENYNQMYKEFKDVADNKIVENEKAIANLKAEARNDKKEANAEFEKKVLTLEMKNIALKEKLRDYKENEIDKWELFKNEFNNDMENLEQALKELVNKNKSN